MNDADARAWMESHVSRETLTRLETFHTLLLQWQKTINLVAPSTLENAWARHFVDSAQLYRLAQTNARTWLDLGSGGGFPGLVVAAMAHEERPDFQITLVESDIRKSGFMREAARRMGIKVQIMTHRISDIPSQTFDVISARALSNLSDLIDFATPHTHQGTQILFPKGGTYRQELEIIPDDWKNTVDQIQSVTDPDAVILRFMAPKIERNH